MFTAHQLFIACLDTACRATLDLNLIRETLIQSVKLSHELGLLALPQDQWVIVVSGQANGDITADFTPRALYDRPDISTVAKGNMSSCAVGGVTYLGHGDCGFTALEDLVRVLDRGGVFKKDKPETETKPETEPGLIPEPGEVWAADDGDTAAVLKVSSAGLSEALVTFRARMTGRVEHMWPVSIFLKAYKTKTTLRVGSRSFHIGQILNCKDGSRSEILGFGFSGNHNAAVKFRDLGNGQEYTFLSRWFAEDHPEEEQAALTPTPPAAPPEFVAGQRWLCDDGEVSVVTGVGNGRVCFREESDGSRHPYVFRWTEESFRKSHPGGLVK